MTQKRPWQEVVASKKKLQFQALSSFAGGPTETEITNIPDARTLIAKITSGEVTCEAVLRSYITKASEAHSIVWQSCLTEVLFDDALKRARELDNYFNTNGRPFGPLHGLPVTLKDQFDVEGWDTTLGYVGRAFQPATTDAALVAMLRSLGAVIIAKTNLPQSIMWGETDNPLFGLTTHHLNKSYTPGGSTGGESALLAYGGSILGWGTDIGGSIRGPAHMMGLYGLKPSNARLPYRGVPVSTDGQEHVPSAVGPLARTLDTVHLAVKSIIDVKPWEKDPRCVPIPWREEAYSDTLARPLVVGVLPDDGVVRPHPPMRRVLQSTVDLLRSAGHHIVEWNAEFHSDCIAVQNAFYTADGGEDIRTAVAAGGEPLIPHVERLVNRDKAISVYDYWQLNRRKWELQQAYLDKWESIRCPATGRTVDVLLLPPMPHTAVPHGSCGWTGYTKVWNFLDYTACVVPGGCVQEIDLKAPWDEYELRGPMDELCHNVWNRNKAEMAELRLPIGIQIVGRRLEEEKVLGAAKVVDDLRKGL